MKIFINNRNWLTYPKAMAEQFANQNHEIIFIDNESTYQPLLDYYNDCSFQVIKCANLGGTAAWSANIVNDLNEYYVVTDPDYDLSMIPEDWPEVLIEGLDRFPNVNKVGLSWDESKVPPENPAWIADEFYKYPEGNPLTWGHPLPNNFWHYPCDTSFAVYRPRTPFRIEGVRKGRPYTGTHIPWHFVLEESKTEGKLSVIFNDEILYYFEHCLGAHEGGWSFTKGRMLEMINEYKNKNN